MFEERLDHISGDSSNLTPHELDRVVDLCFHLLIGFDAVASPDRGSERLKSDVGSAAEKSILGW
jgi:hypothetical protein